MPQIFHRSTNTLSKASIFGAVFFMAVLLWVIAEVNRSAYNTGAYVERGQPVQFSHKHHSGDDGLDCRYCHTSVEHSASAGMPSTGICMNCHSQIWSESPALEPVRESWRSGTPIRWTRIHDLPDYVYFNHSIHVNKGVGCSSCHGRVDRMPLMAQVASLQMEWCLDCHRHPERVLRPARQVYNMEWEPPPNQIEEGRRLIREYRIPSRALLTNCSTCHR